MHYSLVHTSLWLCVTILSSLGSVEVVDWCSLKCKDGSENTMCKYKPVSATDSCTIIRESTTPTIRQEMLELHNVYRNALAGGGMPGWPEAADMRFMTWDGDLEQLGLRWAMQCVPGHDQCRRTPAFEYIGQNFGMVGSSAFYPSSNMSFQGWVDEIRLTTSAMVTSFTGGKWGHFTQIGWANSYKLGCGEVQYIESNIKKTTIVCNYGPAGNIVTLGMYTEGKHCSKCPAGTSCQNESIYPNLCTAPAYDAPRPRSIESLKDASSRSLKDISKIWLLFNWMVIHVVPWWKNKRKTPVSNVVLPIIVWNTYICRNSSSMLLMLETVRDFRGLQNPLFWPNSVQ